MGERIVINPDIMVGKPIIKGTRITVEIILKLLAQGISEKEILEDYPQLKKGDIKAVLEYSAKVISNEEILPLGVDKGAKVSSG